ncbi:MAG: LLM class F420-dependent oxidoreductase, partial [Rhodospirillaceae bacterium]|nr:LLM class F420-dependent oxidoreductase [Rhodospirillaceae bacterium]
MRYGFYLPTRGPLGNPNDIGAIAQAGERLGYATIVIGDHIVFPV